MIRINIRNMEEICEIYGPSGELVKTIGTRIENEVYAGTELIKDVLRSWFYRDGEVSMQAISDYLLFPNTRETIESFAKTACKAKWENEGLFHALLQYNARATKRKHAVCIKELSPFLNNDHINENMFDFIDKRGNNVRLRSTDDLSANKPMYLKLRDSDDVAELWESCKTIFDYDDFSKKYRDKVLNAIGVSVCPYCNRQYISHFGTDNKKRNSGDIDHFYNKDSYPFLALSLFNFVPSCQICNSRLKHTKDFYINPHINPYEQNFGNGVRFEIDNLESILNPSIEPKIKLKYDSKQIEYANSAETFHLEELYSNHCDYAKEIIKKAKVFNDSKIKEYVEKYGSLFTSKSELYRTLYGNYLDEDDQGKRPLSKLTQDLLYDLNVRTE